jgi:hypothetical protein
LMPWTGSGRDAGGMGADGCGGGPVGDRLRRSGRRSASRGGGTDRCRSRAGARGRCLALHGL